MPDKKELKQRACAAIEARKEEIIAIAKDVLNNPEPGFSEVKTSRLVQSKFDQLGITHKDGLAITGVKGRIAGGAGEGPRVAIIGELDSLIVDQHPHADPETKAAHACGHHCQIGMMLGSTLALTQEDILSQLSGEILPFAVPAEEFIEVGKRLELRDQNKLEFLGGKQELIKLGEFDDVDISVMCHTASEMGDQTFALGGTSNGHVVKYVKFIGRGAHAGSAPHLGINALNAATFALQAINSNRETFKDDETVRIHGIMSKGGEAVNAVPSDVRLEWRVRSGTPKAVVKNSSVVDRCFKAGALAVGASVNITNIPGYLPMRNDSRLQDLFQENASQLIGKSKVLVMPPGRNRGGSTDMGDLSQLMPVCHPYTSGAVGAGHSKDYLVIDYESAVITPAKIMAMVVVDLLADGGVKGREIMSEHRPAMKKASYLRFQRERAEVIEYSAE